MSAKTWEYSAPRAPAYDVPCLSLRRSFVNAGVACVSGVAELQGLKLADAIGHVHEDSAGAVFAAYKSWVRRCVVAAESQPTQLDVPEQEELQSPLPPPLEPLPPPALTCNVSVSVDRAAARVLECPASPRACQVRTVLWEGFGWSLDTVRVRLSQRGMVLGPNAFVDVGLVVDVERIPPEKLPEVPRPWVAYWSF